ncbi:hypothetical protein D6850_14200 [Roseovarius spongiae]|uniref:Translocase n=1 Tax=Roseovarius spongiae TaxID=2320272 RepID=A0A3A8ASL7_9RHOB|nr:hypothetical protein [Roseovarius spongiae]RKF13449.1 hypothetical protein D6850_14200 [Roseovarius spongiae]
MSRIRFLTLGCGTVAAALFAGYFIQHSDASAPAVAAPAEQPDGMSGAADEVNLNSITLTSALPEAPAEMSFAALPTPEITLAALDDTPIGDMPGEEPAPAFNCDYTLDATPAAGAMVDLNLAAPCAPNERFTLHHNGLMISAVTDADGQWSAQAPALARTAVYIVAFPNGDGAVANVSVPSLDQYDRVAVQWRGDSGIHIHALEYGADYGEAGHVWADAPHGVEQAVAGDSGFLTPLGDPNLPDALRAEVYTFPSTIAGEDGDVRLVVEASVTRDNCGRDVEAQSIEVSAAGAPRVQDLTLAVPECNAVGDFLVLKNLLNDLKIARK